MVERVREGMRERERVRVEEKDNRLYTSEALGVNLELGISSKFYQELIMLSQVSSKTLRRILESFAN